MGQRLKCTARIDGKRAEGMALLETKELVFRGTERLVIPLSEVTAATARSGSLLVAFAGRRAEFDLGDAAAKWAARITNPPSRLDKLGIKAGMTILMQRHSDDELSREIAARGARIVRKAADGADAIFFGASRRADLDGLAAAVPLMKPNGALWVIRPKGVEAITEAETMAAGKRAGLVDVKVVSYSATHTAEKFVIPVAKRATPSRVSPPRGKR
jgi:hypothetical protein